MIRTSLKTFFKNLVFLFIPMGIFYLFLLIAGIWFVSEIFSLAGSTLSRLTALIDRSAAASSASVNEFLSYSFGKIDWDGGLFAALKQILTTGWIKETVEGFFGTLNATTEGFEEELGVIVEDFSSTLMTAVSLAVSFIVLGVLLANFMTRFAIRRRSAKRGLKKFLLAHVLVPVVQAAVIVLSIGLFTVIRYYSLLVFCVLLLLLSALSLTASWIVHRDGKVRLREVLTVKNALGQLAAAALFLLMDLVIVLLLFLADPLLAVLLAIPFLLYTFNIVDLNTDVFVCALAGEREAEQERPAQTESIERS